MTELAITILMADDDEDDCLLAQTAFEEAGMLQELRMVADGEELMEYLHREGIFSDSRKSPRPSLILLDLNMPKKDGREALKEIKSNPDLWSIPVVILTTSSEERDIEFCRQAGVASFITKPTEFSEWVKIVESLTTYLTVCSAS